MAAFGRKLPFDSLEFQRIERPLLVEADVRNRDSGSRNFALEVRHLNDRYTLQSGHWAKLVVNGR
jgi:hypothetical protein